MKAPVGAAVAAVAESDRKAKEELLIPLEAAQGQANAAVGAAAGAVEQGKEQLVGQANAAVGAAVGAVEQGKEQLVQQGNAVKGQFTSLFNNAKSFKEKAEQTAKSATTPTGMLALVSGQTQATQPVLQGQQLERRDSIKYPTLLSPSH